MLQFVTHWNIREVRVDFFVLATINKRKQTSTLRLTWRSVVVAVQTTGEAATETKRLNSHLPKTLKYFYFNKSSCLFSFNPSCVCEGRNDKKLIVRQTDICRFIAGKQQASRRVSNEQLRS